MEWVVTGITEFPIAAETQEDSGWPLGCFRDADWISIMDILFLLSNTPLLFYWSLYKPFPPGRTFSLTLSSRVSGEVQAKLHLSQPLEWSHDLGRSNQGFACALPYRLFQWGIMISSLPFIHSFCSAVVNPSKDSDVSIALCLVYFSKFSITHTSYHYNIKIALISHEIIVSNLTRGVPTMKKKGCMPLFF